MRKDLEGRQQEMEVQAIPGRRLSRQSSGDSSSNRTLPKKCIFCKKDKYIKNSNTRETLSECIQLRADNNIRKLATERSDADILAVASDELIATEARYHATCYKLYTKPETRKVQVDAEPNQDDGISDVIKKLIRLRKNPDVIEFKTLQSLMTTPSVQNPVRSFLEDTL